MLFVVTVQTPVTVWGGGGVRVSTKQPGQGHCCFLCELLYTLITADSPDKRDVERTNLARQPKGTAEVGSAEQLL